METNDGSHAGGENVPEDRGGFLEARTLIPTCVEKFVHTTIGKHRYLVPLFPHIA